MKNSAFWDKQGERHFVRFISYLHENHKCHMCKRKFDKPLTRHKKKDPWWNMVTAEVWFHFKETHGLDRDFFRESLDNIFREDDKRLTLKND